MHDRIVFAMFTGLALTGAASLGAGCSMLSESEIEIASHVQALEEPAALVAQGQELQGQELQGQELQGQELGGFKLTTLSLGGQPLINARVEGGELVAQTLQLATLRGRDLIGVELIGVTTGGAHLTFRIGNIVSVEQPEEVLDGGLGGDVHPPVAPELGPAWHPIYSQPRTRTYLYHIEQCLDCDGTWRRSHQWAAACQSDDTEPFFERWALAIGAVWRPVTYLGLNPGDPDFTDLAARVESTTEFTFACLGGALAKCTKWGYREWESDNMADMHQACVRMARADYCGDGQSHTENGTLIDIADQLLVPSRQSLSGVVPDGVFPEFDWGLEAYWGRYGAYCADHARLTTYPDGIVGLCGSETNRYGSASGICDPDDLAGHGVPAGDPSLYNHGKQSLGIGGGNP